MSGREEAVEDDDHAPARCRPYRHVHEHTHRARTVTTHTHPHWHAAGSGGRDHHPIARPPGKAAVLER